MQAYGRDGICSKRSCPVTAMTARGMTKPGNIAPKAGILASSQIHWIDKAVFYDRDTEEWGTSL